MSFVVFPKPSPQPMELNQVNNLAKLTQGLKVNSGESPLRPELLLVEQTHFLENSFSVFVFELFSFELFS